MRFNNSFTNFVLYAVLVTGPLYPSSVKTPKTLENWLKTNFTYQWEDGDYWKTPKETVKDKGGDCEDFSILAKKILTDLGYSSYLVVLTPKKDDDYGHAICVFKEKDNTIGIFDNQYYQNTTYFNMNDAIDKHYSKFDKAYICKSKTICKKIHTIR